MAFASWFLSSAAVAVLAWLAQKKLRLTQRIGVIGDSAQAVEQLPPDKSHAVYAIGDLHADYDCAVHWVNRTGLIKNMNHPLDEWTWTDPTSRLVFVGDYIDKGPTGRQTVEFVKHLTDLFPDHVTALMGNHELELLLDRDSRRKIAWGGESLFHHFAHSAIHPGEYLNFVQDPDDIDHLVVEALYNASAHVYSRGLHNQVKMIPRLNDTRSILRWIPEPFRETAQERLERYQQLYLGAFRSGTILGGWLEQRPIVALINRTLFVHGGLEPPVDGDPASKVLQLYGIDGINQLFRDRSSQDTLTTFIMDTVEGNAIYNMLTYRGNHRVPHSCQYLPGILSAFDAARLAVGHHPADHVGLRCENESFLALDSSLSRWYRNSHGQYCHGRTQHSYGDFKCGKMNEQCEGEIVRIKDNRVELIHSTPMA